MEKEEKDNIKKDKKLINKKKTRPEKSPTKKPQKENKLKETAFYKEDNIDIDTEIKNDEKELGLIEENENEKDNKTTANNIKEKLISSTNTNKDWVNKTRTLIVASRGISHQERHLVNDLINLIPNSKKECKIERDIASEELNNICYMHSCKFCIYFEHRKRELVMWLFKSPSGPLVKFAVTNIHALNEIKLMGNCIKYSRPLLSFDKSFDEQEHLKLIKEMLIQTFNSPRGHPKTKPFYDHQICFYNIDNQIFIRVYQILNEIKEKFTNADQEEKIQLLEIGPRFSMKLIRIFSDSLGGKTLYLNKNYIAPGIIIKRKADNFKKRQIKEQSEKIDLQNKLDNMEDIKQKWLKNE
jgi:ribosome biogenesis protein BRX1